MIVKRNVIHSQCYGFWLAVQIRHTLFCFGKFDGYAHYLKLFVPRKSPVWFSRGHSSPRGVSK